MNARERRRRLALHLAKEQGAPPVLWWLSFCDPSKAAGSQFLGVAVVAAPGFIHAQQKAWALGINPGGEVRGEQVEDVPAAYHNRLLTRAELETAGLVEI